MLPPERISIFVPSLEGGGAERVMVNLANGFAGKGFPVDVVLAKAVGPYLGELLPAVNVVDLGASRMIRSLPALVRYLREVRPAVLLSGLSHANALAILAQRLARMNTRVVISEHNSVATIRAQGARGMLMLTAMRCLYPLADAVVCVSQGVADELRGLARLPKSRVHVIHNPVVSSLMKDLMQAPVQYPWIANEALPLILAVGRLTAVKDFPTLLRAFAVLQQKRKARLVILGEGTERDKLQSLAESLGIAADVIMPGFVENPFAVMRKASVFVMSSRREGLPGALIEAMACGTPVVSTDCPSGPAEILENGRWGRLVSVGDHVALATAIEATLTERLHPDVVLRARDFSVEQAVQHYLDVII